MSLLFDKFAYWNTKRLTRKALLELLPNGELKDGDVLELIATRQQIKIKLIEGDVYSGKMEGRKLTSKEVSIPFKVELQQLIDAVSRIIGVKHNQKGEYIWWQ